MVQEIEMMSHVAFGVMGILIGVWLFAELLHASERNLRRMTYLSIGLGMSMWLSYLIAGHWYVNYYPADKAIILAGDWPWAHQFFMEAKEHLFFILLMAATYLPIAIRSKLLQTDQNYQRMVLALTGVVVAIGLTMDAMGAIIATGVRIGLEG